MEEQCPWCRGYFPETYGPVHEYIESSPGCWKAYCDVLAREYENYSRTHEIHRLTVDTYAAQHPGIPGRKSTQSVWGHLVSLYCVLEMGFSGRLARDKLGKFVLQKRPLEWLTPPHFDQTINVGLVAQANTLDEHISMVRSWSESVWGAWREKYRTRISEVVESL